MRLDPPARKTDLASVISELCGALRKQYGRRMRTINHQDEHGGGSKRLLWHGS